MRAQAAYPPALSAGYEAVVMGGSAGGLKVMTIILSVLPPDYALSVLLVQHLHPDDDGAFARRLASVARRPVIEPCDKERIERGQVYTAPANYHMLVEGNGTIALSTDAKIHWSRPSIDVLFESAALAYGKRVLAVILSGASVDGAAGIRAVKAAGGRTIAQDPATSEFPLMPRAAIDTGAVDEVLTGEEIGRRLSELDHRNR